MIRHIVALLFIVIAHLMALQWMSHMRVIQIHPGEIVPVRLYETTQAAAETKTSVAPPNKTIARKKKASISHSNKTSIKPSLLSSNSALESIPDIKPAFSTDQTEPPVAAALPGQAAPALIISPPPSASYLMDVTRTEPNLANPYFGSGEIRWRNNGASYTLQVEAGVDLFFTSVRLYTLQSEGSIGATGIRPHITTETRRGKSTTYTYFNDDNHTISFSSDPTIIPLSDNAQDKATVLMQLAGIGNADPTQFQAGKQINLQVAEEKEAHTHQFTALGQETITTKMGPLLTWHIVRPPRAGQYSSCIDIWLAPELGWLPVQIRNTEANGAITTQAIRKIIEGLQK